MPNHVVVDGSNLATEGRSLPSLDQLNQAVLDYKSEHPDAEVIVIVDATFGHRIDASERPLFEDAIVHQELVAPPAGAIGRGDAFVLRIAEKIGATVLSNDSFQEFHAEHEWLFESGRLIGGKPIPGVGWIFTPRTPVRGPKSREVTSQAKRKRKGTVLAEVAPVSGAELLERGKAAVAKLPKPSKPAAPAGRGRGGEVDKAIAAATVEAVDPELVVDGAGGGKRRKRRRKGGSGAGAAPAEPLNVPGDFLRFVADHRPGATILGTVDQFSSHGAFVVSEGLRCYVPMSLMGVPAPRAARDVLAKGEEREFVVRAYDAARRGIELMLPGVDAPIGPVTDDTVAAEVGEDAVEPDDAPPTRGRRRKAAAPVAPPTDDAAEVGPDAPQPTRGRRKAAIAEVPAEPADAPAAPAKRRTTKKAPAAAAEEVRAEVAAEAGAEAAAPVATRRSKKAAPGVVEAVPATEPAAPAKRSPSRRAAGAPVSEAVPEAAVPKRAAASRSAAKKAAAVPDQAAATPSAKRAGATKKAAPAVEPVSAPEAPKPSRASRKAGAPGAIGAPAAKTATTKKAATAGAPARKASATKSVASKAAPTKAAPVKRAAAKEGAVEAAATKKVAAKKVAAKKAPAKKVAAKKAPAAKAAKATRTAKRSDPTG